MDNSDRPSYLLWPIRAAKFVKPIGIEHFFDAFSLEKKRPLKIDAASALNIQVNDVSDSLVVNQDNFFWLGAAWVKSRAERPSVSGVNRQLHVQIGCKLGIRNRKDELTKQAKRNKLRIKPGGN